MNLREYIFYHNTTYVALSALADCGPEYLSRISNGRYIPSKRLAKRIERATNGEVTAESLLNPDKEGIRTKKLSV